MKDPVLIFTSAAVGAFVGITVMALQPKQVSANQPAQPAQVIYRGDPPESARLKAYAECLKTTVNTSSISFTMCDHRFGR